MSTSSPLIFVGVVGIWGAFLGSLHPSLYFMTRLLYAVPVPQQAYITTKHKETVCSCFITYIYIILYTSLHV